MIGHRQMLQQNSDENIKRQGLQQVVFQQAHHAHWKRNQDRQVDAADHEANGGKGAGNTDQQGPHWQASECDQQA